MVNPSLLLLKANRSEFPARESERVYPGLENERECLH
jgi:hypothetical protein